MDIRDARPEELGLVGEQTLEAYSQYRDDFPTAYWEPYVTELLDAAGRAQIGDVLVAAVEDELVGSASIHPDPIEPATAYLKMLAVVPAGRRTGAALALMDAAFQRARGMGAEVLKWNTLNFMEPAIRLYERLGYAPEQHDQLDERITLFTYRVKC